MRTLTMAAISARPKIIPFPVDIGQLQALCSQSCFPRGSVHEVISAQDVPVTLVPAAERREVGRCAFAVCWNLLRSGFTLLLVPRVPSVFFSPWHLSGSSRHVYPKAPRPPRPLASHFDALQDSGHEEAARPGPARLFEHRSIMCSARRHLLRRTGHNV